MFAPPARKPRFWCLQSTQSKKALFSKKLFISGSVKNEGGQDANLVIIFSWPNVAVFEVDVGIVKFCKK